MFNIQTNIELDGKNVVLTDIQETGKAGEVEFMVFKTCPEINFVKISANESDSGIEAEYSWIRYKYPGFKPIQQSLAKKEVNGIHYTLIFLKLKMMKQKRLRKYILRFQIFMVNEWSLLCLALIKKTPQADTPHPHLKNLIKEGGIKRCGTLNSKN